MTSCFPSVLGRVVFFRVLVPLPLVVFLAVDLVFLEAPAEDLVTI